MEDLIKKLRLGTAAMAILTIIIGLLFCFHPFTTTTVVAILGGIVLLISGIIELVNYFTQKNVTADSSLVLGVLKAILGLFAILNTGDVMVLFSYVFSVFVIVDAVMNIQRSLMLKQAQAGLWWIVLILAILLMACGIFMMFNSIGTLELLATWVGIILVYDGIVNLGTLHWVKRNIG